MRDKEKQIKEMAKVLSTVKRCEALALSECIKKKCEYPHYEGVTCIAEHQAETLYEQGYQKLPKDSVVLSREEYEKYLQEKYEQGKFDIQCDLEKHDKYLLTKREYNEIMREGQCITDLIIKAKDQESKETAEKYHKAMRKVIHERDYIEGYAEIGLQEENNEIAKQFGVEIKE